MKPKLLYLIAEDWFFCSHFIARAVAAQKAGWDVVVLTHINEHADTIRAAGLRLLPLPLDRRSTNPLKELDVIRHVAQVYRAEKPDLVHHVALKPVLYGTLAAKLAKIKNIVNAPVGMGYIFSSSSLKARLLRLPMRWALRWLLNPRESRVIFENRDDLDSLVAAKAVRREDAALIRGAGINLDVFHPTPEPEGVPVVVLTARMLWDKGIGEFVEAARLVRQRGLAARFVLVGAPDPLNHAAIDEKLLRQWQAEGVIEWWGHRTDIAAILAASHIVCLPSYREGLPKSLLEALAASRPIVTTDVPGCREAVTDGTNGLLVPAYDVPALADALAALLASKEKRLALGRKGRERAEKEFSEERVIAETLVVYSTLRDRKSPSSE